MIIEDKEQIDDQIRALNRDSIKVWDDLLEENLTANFVLDKPEWRRVYEKLRYEFERVDSESLFVYPFERLHMTFLGRIDKGLNHEEVVRAIQKVLRGRRITFRIGYLACNEQSVSIVAEPDLDLAKLRIDLRNELGIKGDDYTKYLPIFEKLAWLNFIRFRKVPNEMFFETLWKMRNYQLGEYTPTSISLYMNRSRTMDPTRGYLLNKIEIVSEL